MPTLQVNLKVATWVSTVEEYKDRGVAIYIIFAGLEFLISINCNTNSFRVFARQEVPLRNLKNER